MTFFVNTKLTEVSTSDCSWDPDTETFGLEISEITSTLNIVGIDLSWTLRDLFRWIQVNENGIAMGDKVGFMLVSHKTNRKILMVFSHEDRIEESQEIGAWVFKPWFKKDRCFKQFLIFND